jgi:hypothetical protein
VGGTLMTTTAALMTAAVAELVKLTAAQIDIEI